MRRIHLGYSNHLDFEGIRSLMDVDPDHPDGIPRFQRMFGTGHIRPGDYEIYDREDVPGFTMASLRALVPFVLPDHLTLFDQDLADAKTVFFVHDDSEWSTSTADGVVMTDDFEVDRFSFE